MRASQLRFRRGSRGRRIARGVNLAAALGVSVVLLAGFTAQGVPDIRAASDRDMFLALGYVHARFRLSEMDEERRLGEGAWPSWAVRRTWPPTSSSCAWACSAPRSRNGPSCPGTA